MKTVSIIVPVYRVEPYLRTCVDSILSQTYRDLQVILVDDGSPDSCGAICDDYAAKDSRVLALHKKNGGVSSARNFGLDHATGTYITFCDGDDCYVPDWIRQLVEAMEVHQPDVVVGGYTFQSENGVPGETCPHEPGMWNTESAEAKMEYCFSMVMQDRHGGEVWDRLFRRKIIVDNQLRFCETCANYAEDLGFVLSYSMHAGVVTAIESCGYQYRIRSGSMMQSSMSVPKLESVHQVYLSLEPVCRQAFTSETARWMLPRLYLQLINMQFMSKLWSSGIMPQALRETAISGVRDWPDMNRRLRDCLRLKNWKNPWYSGSCNLEVYCHIRYLLGGSWTVLRIQCRLIRMLRPFLDIVVK